MRGGLGCPGCCPGCWLSSDLKSLLYKPVISSNHSTFTYPCCADSVRWYHLSSARLRIGNSASADTKGKNSETLVDRLLSRFCNPHVTIKQAKWNKIPERQNPLGTEQHPQFYQATNQLKAQATHSHHHAVPHRHRECTPQCCSSQFSPSAAGSLSGHSSSSGGAVAVARAASAGMLSAAVTALTRTCSSSSSSCSIFGCREAVGAGPSANV